MTFLSKPLPDAVAKVAVTILNAICGLVTDVMINRNSVRAYSPLLRIFLNSLLFLLSIHTFYGKGNRKQDQYFLLFQKHYLFT